MPRGSGCTGYTASSWTRQLRCHARKRIPGCRASFGPRTSAKKVVASVSFVSGDASADDDFGHGTHVAGIIAGSGSPALPVTNLYTGGIAPGAQLINIRVLGSDGSGLTSDVIAGIDWAVAHRADYNIRVINLSLGHSVTEPCATDPLCEAVERAVSRHREHLPAAVAAQVAASAATAPEAAATTTVSPACGLPISSRPV